MSHQCDWEGCNKTDVEDDVSVCEEHWYELPISMRNEHRMRYRTHENTDGGHVYIVNKIKQYSRDRKEPEVKGGIVQ